ncbi:MAG: hypothetical protein CVT89_05355 [Candidatus Altiarchaeales archaeon HGW-Altiarchaeales-2]|nr:MAG: hypothetical protein CVT89_05355 [Candidatus Altiarchaeales archaeon HGW-Altiarchaeales-2]
MIKIEILSALNGISFLFTRLEGKVLSRKIEEMINKSPSEKEILLDFREMTFISRSFADEIRKIKKKLENSGVSVKYINVCENVQKMIDVVERSVQKTNVPTMDFSLIPIKNFSSC